MIGLLTPVQACDHHIRMPLISSMWLGCTDFDRLHTAADIEHLVRTAVRGVPEAWIPEIARQCLYAPASDSGKRCAVPPPA